LATSAQVDGLANAAPGESRATDPLDGENKGRRAQIAIFLPGDVAHACIGAPHDLLELGIDVTEFPSELIAPQPIGCCIAQIRSALI